MGWAKPDRCLLVAAGSGILLAAAFPRPDLYPLAWIALIPLLLVMRQRPFATGFTAGLVFFAAVLYWLNLVMTTYGGLSPVLSLLAYLFLLSYLAVYFGLATWLAVTLEKNLKIPYLFTLPPIWVAFEYLRSWLFTGFPWGIIGYSQQNFSVAIQSSDVTGIYGVSLMLVAVNCALAGIIATPKRGLAQLGVVATIMISISHFGYGVWRQGQPLEQRQEQLQVALIQGDIAQGQKWQPQQRQATIDKYISLSTTASSSNPDLLIWPEAATPFFLQDDSKLAVEVKALPRQLNIPLLVGSPAYSQATAGKYQYYNRAYLFAATGEEIGHSDKIHLVPFGEYVPLGKLLAFINKMVVGMGDFSPGKIQPLPLDGHSLGVLICYEAIFPQLARQYVLGGSDLLVNLTNDAWFGRTSAPYQLLAMTRFRAIENRIWIARAANTGISAFVSPAGRVVAASPIFEPLHLSGTVGLGAKATFYTRYGDLFAKFCVFVVFVLILALLRKRKLD